MKNNSTVNMNQKYESIQKEIQPTLYGYYLKKVLYYSEIEKKMNSQILKTIMKINTKYPELTKYLEEMLETIPDEINPEITITNLTRYYNSLDNMLNKYILEHTNNKA